MIYFLFINIERNGPLYSVFEVECLSIKTFDLEILKFKTP